MTADALDARERLAELARHIDGNGPVALTSHADRRLVADTLRAYLRAGARSSADPASLQTALPDTEELHARIEKAHAALNRLCGGEKFTMSIPVRPDYDHDVLLCDGLMAGAEAVRALNPESAVEKGLTPDV